MFKYNLTLTILVVMFPLGLYAIDGVDLPEVGENQLIIDLGNDIYLELLWIPPGTFRMGSPEGEQDRSHDEGPAFDISIKSGFWMGKYPVTQAQWQLVMKDNPSYFIDNSNHPVEQVTIEMCQQFIELLNQNFKPEDNNGTFRLPTEPEWEYACRANTQSRYYYGDDPDYKLLVNYAWHKANSRNETQPVGQKTPNAFGLYDMHGNVWEICKDDYTPYYLRSFDIETEKNIPQQLYPEPVLRGGSWFSSAEKCRSSYRHILFRSSNTVGFRLIYDVDVE